MQVNIIEQSHVFCIVASDVKVGFNGPDGFGLLHGARLAPRAHIFTVEFGVGDLGEHVLGLDLGLVVGLDSEVESVAVVVVEAVVHTRDFVHTLEVLAADPILVRVVRAAAPVQRLRHLVKLVFLEVCRLE